MPDVAGLTKHILNDGICFNFCWSQDGITALMLASARGYSDCVKLLVEADANKEAKSLDVRSFIYMMFRML